MSAEPIVLPLRAAARTAAALRPIVLFALALLVAAALPRHAFAEPTTTCSHWNLGLLSGETFNGTDGTVYASTLWDPDGAGPQPERFVLGGAFLSVQFSLTGRIAVRIPGSIYWDAPLESWNIPPVKSLGVFQNQLIVGGSNIYRYDGSSFEVMGAGIASGEVQSITVFDGQLYIGGTFTLVGGGQYFARWTGSGWETVFGGPNGEVRAMAQYGNALVVAGLFSSVGSPSFAVANIARFDGQWSSMGTGMSNVVSCLQAYGGFMYAGGSFTTAGGASTGGLARWNGTSWSSASGFFLGSVFCMTVYGGQLVLGGEFPGLSAPNLARYNGTTYSTFGSVGANGRVFTALPAEGYLYVGGAFDHVGAVPARCLARWNGAAWLPVGGGSANQVRAFQPFFGGLVVGGDFVESIDPYPAAFDLGSWNGLTFTNFGSGTNGLVTALESFQYGPLGSLELLAGGTFTTAGGVGASRIARWNQSPDSPLPPPAWQAMGAGFNDVVYAIKRYNGVTYAAGTFTMSGTTPVSRIARWNEASDVWEAVGPGLNGTVYALEVYNGALYAGGSFTNAGAVSCGGFARWDGSTWSNIGGFFLGTVYALEIYSGRLVMAGQFNGFGGSPNLSSTNGSSYANFGTGGADGPIYALAVHEGNLVIGGEFGFAGNQPARRLAWWNGTAWSEIEGGTDDTIYALASFQGELHVGGWFASYGNDLAFGNRWVRYSTTGLPTFVRQPSSVTVAPGGTASFTAEPVETFKSQQRRWYRGTDLLSDGPTGTGSTVSGTTQKTLSIQNVSVADAGVYVRRVTILGCGEVSSNAASLTLNIVGVGDDAPPLRTALELVAPNPSRGASVLGYALERDAVVALRIFDVSGRAVRRIAPGAKPAGRHQEVWDALTDGGARVSPGLYFVRLDVDGRAVGTRKLVVGN